MNSDRKDFKATPYPGVPNVEEVEHDGTATRVLAPTAAWTDALQGTPQGTAVYAAYMMMAVAGVPAHVIITVAAVRFADLEGKIDYAEWIRTRSGWPQEDQDGAIKLISETASPQQLSSTQAHAAPAVSSPVKKGWNVN